MGARLFQKIEAIKLIIWRETDKDFWWCWTQKTRFLLEVCYTGMLNNGLKEGNNKIAVSVIPSPENHLNAPILCG